MCGLWSSPIRAKVLACVVLGCAAALDVPIINAQSTTSDAHVLVGLAKVDVTPDFPVRLCGFTGRKSESNEIRQRIFARAMAVRTNGEPAVLITVDSIGIPAELRREVVRGLEQKRGVLAARVAICSTHSHTTPTLKDVLPTMFGEALSPTQQAHVDRYTRELTAKVEQAALAALEDLRPSRLSFGIGQIGFAENRRTPGGPVDHQMPMLAVFDPNGNVRGIYLSYACHCVLLRDNKISGDWAGYASEEIEKQFPNSVGLVSIGCGADANPATDTTEDQGSVAQQYGKDICAEVQRLLAGKLADITGALECSIEELVLPLKKVPPIDYWAAHLHDEFVPDAYYAGVQLERLKKGDKLPSGVPYPIQTWEFGKSLAMIFLPGEVVVDYSHRLKREFDSDRIWVNAYSNEAPCYIPSERVLKEGGYEAGEAMRYYGLPAWLAPGLEDKIIAAVHRQIGDHFAADPPRGTQGMLPKRPEESLATIRVPDGLKVELVAAEPLISSPVAIDFGPDGRVWVVEMHDYAQTNDGSAGPPRGRVVVLTDSDQDGKYETSQVFLDGLSCPTAVTVWRSGVLIGASPDVLYAEDANGDGTADIVKTLYSGFGTQHPQARVNNMSYGLDGWVYAANSFGGKIHCKVLGKDVQLPDSDFRFKPDTGEIEAVAGRTEHGRARDDWDNWFGCDNSTICYHFPLPIRYLQRNPLLALQSTSVAIADLAASKLIPAGPLVLWPLSGPAGTPTAACGLHVYRDDLLGAEYAGDVFTCEPVHQLVHRMDLEPMGASFTARRPKNEATSEFLTSTDSWFRPVQARTAPDGSLWIVDMYRYVIEHPRWIPDDVLKTLDVLAGKSYGRIYRVAPRETKTQSWPRLDNLSTDELVDKLDTANGWQRDMVQQLLVWRGDESAVSPLEKLAESSARPEARLQALCTLAQLNQLSDEQILRALGDAHPGVRRHAVRLAEKQGGHPSTRLQNELLRLCDDSDSLLSLQLACTLGELPDSPARTTALAKIARRHESDSYIVSAILSSVPAEQVDRLVAAESAGGRSIPLLSRYAELSGITGNPVSIELAMRAAFNVAATTTDERRFAPLAALLSGVARGNSTSLKECTSELLQELHGWVAECESTVQDGAAPLPTRVDCACVLGFAPDSNVDRISTLTMLLSADNSSELQDATLDALSRQLDNQVAKELLDRWPGYSPSLRERVLNILISRRAWGIALLEAIRGGRPSPGEIGPLHRYLLVRNSDPTIRKLAAECFAEQSSSERAGIAEQYAKELPAGDPARGRDQFQKNCASCHQHQGVGNRIGPDLAGLKDKSNIWLLREILDPNRAVDPRYAQYLIITQDGQTLTGILDDETPNSVTLLAQQGKLTTLLRSEIDLLESTGKSLMPEGFEKEISPQQMADLLAFLSPTGEVSDPSAAPSTFVAPPSN